MSSTTQHPQQPSSQSGSQSGATTRPDGMRVPAAYDFETAIATAIGPIRALVQAVLDRNTDLPPLARAALVRISGRLMPLANVDYLVALRDAYDDYADAADADGAAGAPGPR